MSQNTKTMSLGDILNPEQCDEVISICETETDENIVPRLKQYLGQFKEQLESKGVLPDYLAYLLYYKWTSGQMKGASNGNSSAIS